MGRGGSDQVGAVLACRQSAPAPGSGAYRIELADPAGADAPGVENAILEGLYHRLGLDVREITDANQDATSWSGQIEAPAGISLDVLSDAIAAEVKAVGIAERDVQVLAA